MRGKDLFIVLAFAGCVIGQENNNAITDAGVSQTGNTTDSNVTVAQSDDTTTQENQIDPPTTTLKNTEVEKKRSHHRPKRYDCRSAKRGRKI